MIGIILVVAVLAVVSAGGVVLSRRMGWTRSAPKANPTMSDDQLQALVSRVGSLITVKSDEKPTIATIQDIDLLRAQNPAFYKDAKNGDRLLVWSNQAVLYSTSEDKILAVLPIRIEQPPQTATTTAETPVIEVRNGTGTSGLAKTVSDRVKAAGMAVGATSSASKSYQDTLIITAKGKSFPNTVAKLVTLLGGKVSTLAAGESAMKGDILVIVGETYGK